MRHRRMKTKIAISLIVLTALFQSFSLLHKEAGKYYWPKKSEVRWITVRENRLAGARAFLPPKGVIGYVTDRGPEDFERDYFSLQYALSPLMVVNAAGLPPITAVSPQFVVGVFDDPASAARKYAGAQNPYNIIRDFGGGIVLFRRGDWQPGGRREQE